jgi:hypothetical protein
VFLFFKHVRSTYFLSDKWLVHNSCAPLKRHVVGPTWDPHHISKTLYNSYITIVQKFFFCLLMLLKKHVKNICYLNNTCFSHANGHMSILYEGCKKFPTNWFVRNFSHFYPIFWFYFDVLKIIFFFFKAVC